MRCIITHIYLQQNPVTVRFTEILVCGHSLGGALAQLCALNLRIVTGLPITVYTFGSPRVGGRGFAKLMNERIPNNYRIVMVADPLESVPKALPPYVHAGVPCWVGARGNIIIAPSWTERQMLSARMFSMRIEHHGSVNYVEAMKLLATTNTILPQ